MIAVAPARRVHNDSGNGPHRYATNADGEAMRVASAGQPCPLWGVPAEAK